MLVFHGLTSRMLGEGIATILNTKTGDVEIRRFPDGECYVKIKSEVMNEKVILVHNTYPDEKIIECILMCDGLRNAKVSEILLVVPYYGYARQDKMFTKGESVSALAIGKILSSITDKLITVDIHNKSILEEIRNAKDVTVTEEIGRFLKTNEDVDVIISPDEGAKEMARAVASVMNCEWDFLVKKRIDGTTVEIAPKNLDVENRGIAIVDDIIATGGTIVRASEELKRNGARRVIAACTHGLYTSGAVERLKKVCDAVYSSDTLENETTKISAARPICNEISQIISI